MKTRDSTIKEKIGRRIIHKSMSYTGGISKSIMKKRKISLELKKNEKNKLLEMKLFLSSKGLDINSAWNIFEKNRKSIESKGSFDFDEGDCLNK